MKRVFLVMVVSAMLVTLGFAQTPAAGSNTDPATVKGCLGGSDGNYTVAEDGSRQIFKITTSSVDLKPHVGHDVKLIGHKASGAVSSGAADNSFAITELSMISEHCAAAAAATTATIIPPSETVITPVTDAAAPATASAPAVDAAAPVSPSAATASAPAAPAVTVSPSSPTVSTPAVDAAAPAVTVSRTSPIASTPAVDAAAPAVTVSPSAATVSTPPVEASSPGCRSQPDLSGCYPARCGDCRTGATINPCSQTLKSSRRSRGPGCSRYDSQPGPGHRQSGRCGCRNLHCAGQSAFGDCQRT